jgi:N6-adenosine-specific RNA methylase IME4
MTKYRTIVADPPWRYANETVPMGGVAHHYTTMSNVEIAALPIRELAEKDAHLYLWVTNPRLFAEDTDAGVGPREIVKAWGFSYKTLLTWVKPGLGLGYYFRGCTEHVLFATRGRAPIPGELRIANVFDGAHTGGHSAKPDVFGDLVEAVSPGPYLELFARRQRLGWDTWGNEALNHVDLQSA